MKYKIYSVRREVLAPLKTLLSVDPKVFTEVYAGEAENLTSVLQEIGCRVGKETCFRTGLEKSMLLLTIQDGAKQPFVVDPGCVYFIE